MKTFEGENYYQILNVSGSASTTEIRRAYMETLEMYKEDSIVTYTLFPPEEREVLLQTIEKAFETLLDENKRAEYDRMLVDTGQVDPAVFFRQAPKIPAVHSAPQTFSKEKSLIQWAKKKSEAPEIKVLIGEILSRELLSGQDLKRLREAFGIEIDEIYAATRISSATLNMIEADRFGDLPAEIYLKQFLKSYAEILQIDPRHVVEGYLRCKAGGCPDKGGT
jgi:curved DNA-binding protein CbpA